MVQRLDICLPWIARMAVPTPDLKIVFSSCYKQTDPQLKRVFKTYFEADLPQSYKGKFNPKQI